MLFLPGYSPADCNKKETVKHSGITSALMEKERGGERFSEELQAVLKISASIA